MQRVKARAALKSSKKLKKAQLFSGLGDDAVTKLIDCMKDKTFAPGETIVQQGDVAHEFYVITSGTCKVLVDGKFVGSMRTHDHFGETCVSMAARMTNARAWHDGEGEEEIADVVGCPIGTVMSRLHRARKQLQTSLQKHAMQLGIIEDDDTDIEDPIPLEAFRSRKAVKS